MNIDLRLPSEYVEVLQQHVAATGQDIATLVTGIVADRLQAAGCWLKWNMRGQEKSIRERSPSGCRNGPTDIRDSNMTSISAANQSMRAAANEGSR